MKKSARVTLTVVAAMGMAACNRDPDPCRAQTYNDQACQDAVRNHGFYWHGTWHPMDYGSGYPYYYNSYRNYTLGGGSVTTYSEGSYARPSGAAGSAESGTGVVRGGFGSTGAGAGAGE